MGLGTGPFFQQTNKIVFFECVLVLTHTRAPLALLCSTSPPSHHHADFAPVIKHAADVAAGAAASQHGKVYFVLMILTDGAITKDQIVAASHLPMSVSRTGSGNRQSRRGYTSQGTLPRNRRPSRSRSCILSVAGAPSSRPRCRVHGPGATPAG